jgi:hypothetical protein
MAMTQEAVIQHEERFLALVEKALSDIRCLSYQLHTLSQMATDKSDVVLSDSLEAASKIVESAHHKIIRR